jgi:transcriptional regulator with XRE-family HTH domain
MIPRLYRQLGQKIRTQREMIGMTQKDLGKEVGLSRTSVTNVERGRQQMLVHQLIGFAIALKIDSGELLKGLSKASDAVAEAQDIPPEVQKLVDQLRESAPEKG